MMFALIHLMIFYESLLNFNCFVSVSHGNVFDFYPAKTSQTSKEISGH